MPPPSPDTDANKAWAALSGGFGDPTLRPNEEAGRSALQQLVLLRWVAFAGQLVTVLAAHFALGMRLPIGPMVSLLAGLALFNLASQLRARRAREASAWELSAGLLIDMLMLTALLALSGGVNNPFVFLYLPQVAVAALLLKRPLAWALVVAAGIAIVLLASWHVPLQWRDAPAPTLSQDYVLGLLLCFLISASLVVVVIVRSMQTLRRRDERLAALRQRAAEEDHIVRMGLLASGAAHELSTPLATLSVILGDWAHMPALKGDSELREDLDVMQAQVRRCKGIITGILMSAGQARADISGTTTLAAFLTDVATDWSQRHGTAELQPDLGPLPEHPVAADAGLRQMMTNVLDNALEAAPGQLPQMRVRCDNGWLQVAVLDQGPGFAKDILENFGLPYHSSKGKPGGGLGMFLSVNVARKLGGRVRARNRDEGGAEVLIELPLSALIFEPEVEVAPSHAA